MRRWIHNDAESKPEPDADAGFEIEVVDARDHDAALDVLRRSVEAYDAWQNGPDGDGSPEPDYIIDARFIAGPNKETT